MGWRCQRVGLLARLHPAHLCLKHRSANATRPYLRRSFTHSRRCVNSTKSDSTGGGPWHLAPLAKRASPCCNRPKALQSAASWALVTSSRTPWMRFFARTTNSWVASMRLSTRRTWNCACATRRASFKKLTAGSFSPRAWWRPPTCPPWHVLRQWTCLCPWALAALRRRSFPT